MVRYQRQLYVPKIIGVLFFATAIFLIPSAVGDSGVRQTPQLNNLVFLEENTLAAIIPPFWVGSVSSATLADKTQGVANRAIKDDVLEALAKCESGNNPLKVNWDDGGSPSYGLYQFKKTTWEIQIRKYKMLEQATGAELMNFIYDREVQTELAGKMLANGLWRHWLNCGKLIGLDKVP